MNINDWILFSHIVDAGSLSTASQKLGLPKSTLSRRLAALENTIGSRLLSRRGRHFELTDIGHLFYQEASHITKQVAQAKERLIESTHNEAGTIKMAAPRMPGSTFLGSWIAEFITQHPDIHIELDLNDRLVNLFDQAYDIALRVGPMANSSLISRKLAVSQRILVASSHYISPNQAPLTPQDLTQFHCLSFGQQYSGHDTWRLNTHKNNKTQLVHFKPSLRCDDMASILHIVEAGGGIALIPFFIGKKQLNQGQLQHILPQWVGPKAEFYLVYPERELMPKRVQLLIQFLTHKASIDASLFNPLCYH